MQRPILYSFRRCPYAMRARMAIRHVGLEVELREVVLKSKPAEMLEASAKGTVPVLLLADQVIDESLDVMRWALSNTQNSNGWSVAQLEHELVNRNDGYFKHWLDRYKYFDRYPEQPQSEYLANAAVYLAELEEALLGSEQDGYFLLTPKFSSIDAAIFPFVRQCAFVDKAAFDNLGLPKLSKWLGHCLESTLFLSVMQKYPAWSNSQQQPVLFGT